MIRPVLTVQLYREPVEVRRSIGADVAYVVTLSVLGWLVVWIIREAFFV